MITMKKSYARQLLQLAITLSLLRVDPENYLGWGWESQLALQHGDGWQLELRAAPLTDYPYSNRKALIPLIEDLVRFDRQMNNTPSYDVQTYLLNVQNEQVTAMSSNVAPPPQPPSLPQASDTNSTIIATTANAGSIIHQLPQNLTRNTTEFTVPIGSELADLFLNAETFAESASVLDQNLADLNDYENFGEMGGAQDDPFLNFNSLYAGLPLKDEPNDILGERLLNIRFGESEHEASTSNNDSGIDPSNNNALYGLLRAPDSPRVNYSQVIEWSEYFRSDSIKTEEEDNADDELGATVKTEPNDKDADQGTSSSRRNHSTRHDSGMKLESDVEDDIDDVSSHGDSKNSTSGFSSNVELTEEVSAQIIFK